MKKYFEFISCCKKVSKRQENSIGNHRKSNKENRKDPEEEKSDQIPKKSCMICASEQSEDNHLGDKLNYLEKRSENLDLIELNCGECSMCPTCLSNLFQNNLSQKPQMKILDCECSLQISYKIFEPFVLKDSLKIYLEALPKLIDSHFKSFICEECRKIVQVDDNTSGFSSCPDCQASACLKCLQSHDRSVSCKENFMQTQGICKYCKKIEKFELNCNCCVCHRCQLSYLKEQLESDPMKPAVCKACQQTLPVYEQELLFGNKASLIRFREDSLLAARFSCGMCYKDVIVNGSITLYCGHRYCKSCIKSYVEFSISSLPVNSVALNCPSCVQEISFHIINSLIDGPTADQYQRKLLKNLKNQPKNEYLKFCDNCSYAAFISIDERRFECPACKKEMCPHCHGPVSDSCCKNKAMMKSSIGNFYGFVTSCPRCKAKIIKESGCNFIKCESPYCTRVCFCMICNKVLQVRNK